MGPKWGQPGSRSAFAIASQAAMRRTVSAGEGRQERDVCPGEAGPLGAPVPEVWPGIGRMDRESRWPLVAKANMDALTR
jgi:hypothetical protein